MDDMNSTTTPWVGVYTGPMWKLQIVRGRLEGAGMMTHVPNENLRTLDPLAMGGDSFTSEIWVHANDVDVAREIVAAEADSAPESSTGADRAARGTRLPRRMEWWTILIAPVGLALGIVYLWRVHKTGVRPAEHGSNLTMIAAAVLSALVYVCVLYVQIKH